MKLNDADVAGPFFRVSAVKEEGGGREEGIREDKGRLYTFAG